MTVGVVTAGAGIGAGIAAFDGCELVAGDTGAGDTAVTAVFAWFPEGEGSMLVLLQPVETNAQSANRDPMTQPAPPNRPTSDRHHSFTATSLSMQPRNTAHTNRARLAGEALERPQTSATNALRPLGTSTDLFYRSHKKENIRAFLANRGKPWVSEPMMEAGRPGIGKSWVVLPFLLTALGCGGNNSKPTEPTGMLEVASVVAPIYGTTQVKYHTVRAGEPCDGATVDETLGPAGRGDGGAVFAFEPLTLPGGSYGLCATALGADGKAEPHCPVASLAVTVAPGVVSEVYLAVVCDPVVDPRTGHAYTVTPLVVSFLDASKAAIAMGGHLATIDDMEENLFLGQYFARHKWIGLWDTNADGVFEWMDGKARTFSNFCVGEPNRILGENYVEWGFGGKEQDFCWNNEVNYVRQGIVEYE